MQMRRVFFWPGYLSEVVVVYRFAMEKQRPRVCTLCISLGRGRGIANKAEHHPDGEVFSGLAQGGEQGKFGDVSLGAVISSAVPKWIKPHQKSATTGNQSPRLRLPVKRFDREARAWQ